MTRQELTAQMQQAFAGFLGLSSDEVPVDRSIEELGMDSLTAAQLAVDIEERLGVSVFLDDLTGRETIAGLVAALVAKR